MTSAEAPSLIELALAAVTVPSFLNAGFSDGILSGMARCGPSSSFTASTPLRVFTSTGTISASKMPLSPACLARRSDSMANTS